MRSHLLSFRAARRSLAGQPIALVSMIVLLSAGIGAPSALFLAAGTVLHPKLPYANGPSLVRPLLQNQRSLGSDIPADMIDLWSKTKTLEAYAPYSYLIGALYRPGSPAAPMRVNVVVSEPNVFQVLGASPEIGRSFDANAPEHEAIVSHEVWLKEFGSDPTVLGESVLINGALYEIIGVMGRGFYFPAEVHEATVWTARPDVVRGRALTTQVVGKLCPGISKDHATAELNQLSAAWLQAPSKPRLRLVSYDEALSLKLLNSLTAMRVLAGLVWGLCTLILSGMLLVRTLEKHGQMVIVTWLGGSIKQASMLIIAELVIIFGIACPLSFIIAVFTYRKTVELAVTAAPWLAPSLLPMALGKFTAILLFGSAFGIITFLSHATARMIKASGATSRPYYQRGRKAHAMTGRLLIVLELSCALVIIQVAEGLAAKQARLLSDSYGFAPRGILSVDLSAAISGNDPHAQLLAYQKALEAVRQLPWVKQAEISTSLPVVRSSNVQLTLYHNGQSIASLLRAVTPGLVRIEGIRMQSGRSCSPEDSTGTEVAIINDRFAQLYFPGIEPLGKTIALGGAERARVVGVIADVYQVDLDTAPSPELLLCLTQLPQSSLLNSVLAGSTVNMLIHSDYPVTRISVELQETLSRETPILAISHVRDFSEAVNATFALHTAMTTLFSWTAVLSSVLAFFGVYAILEYRNQQRVRENCIRLALGAQWRNVLGPLFTDAFWLATAAIIFGLLLTVFVNRLIESFYRGALVSSAETTGLAISGMVVSIALATVPSLWKTFRMSPATLLRFEN